MTAAGEARSRRWADIAAIVASVASVVPFGYSVWGGVRSGDSSALDEVRNVGLGRASNIVGGLVAFNVIDATALVAAGTPGAALLRAGFFVGPMPTELEERT